MCALQPAHAGWRLDRALAAAVPTLSRERLKALIRSGARREPAAARSATPRPRSAATSSFALAVPEPEPAHNEPQDIPLDDRLRGRASAGRRQARRAGRPPGRRQSRRDAGQRAAPPLRAASCRASAGSPARASSTASTRIRRACWSSPRPTSRTRAGKAVRRAHSIDRRYLAIVVGRAEGEPTGTVDAPLARSSANRKKIAIVEGRPRQARGDPLEAARRRCATRRWSNAGWKPAGPTRSASTWPRSAIRCSATRSTAGPERRIGKLLKELDFQRQALHAAELGFIHPVTKRRLSFASAMPADMQELFNALGV